MTKPVLHNQILTVLLELYNHRQTADPININSCLSGSESQKFHIACELNSLGLAVIDLKYEQMATDPNDMEEYIARILPKKIEFVESFIDIF
jgi:hypothetical protein